MASYKFDMSWYPYNIIKHGLYNTFITINGLDAHFINKNHPVGHKIKQNWSFTCACYWILNLVMTFII